VHELFGSLFWKDNSLAQPITGSPDTVGNFDRDTLTEFIKTRYCGENLLVTAAGKLEHQKVVDQVANEFSAVPMRGESLAVKTPDYHCGLNLRQKRLEQVHICLGTRALPQNHPDRYALYFLNTILGGSMSSRLFQSIREERGLAYSIYSYPHCHSDAGALIVSASTSPAESYNVVGLILDELGNLCREPVPAYEFNAAREQLKGNILLSLENTENRMTRLAKNEIHFGEQTSIDASLRLIEQVTPEDICRMADELFRDEYLALQLLGDPVKSDFSRNDLTIGR